MKLLILTLTGLLLHSGLDAQTTTRTWSAGTGATDFNGTSNYSPTGALATNNILKFDSAVNPGLTLTAHLGIWGVEILSGASGFQLGTTASILTVSDAGITVGANTSATFNNRISSNGTAQQMTFNVGSGGTMTVNGAISPFNRVFYKTGAGTLILSAGMGTSGERFLRNGTALRIDEGTLEIGNAAVFEPDSTLASLNVHLGTLTTAATLKGGGSFSGGLTGKPVTVITYGKTQSTIAPSGDETLTIRNLNASAGATFKFTLGSTSIDGLGTFTGSSGTGGLALDLTGGEAGVTYTLFNYATLTDLEATDFFINSAGYEVAFWNINNGLVEVQFAAVPEPGLAALGLLFLGGIHLIARRPRKALSIS